MDSAVNFQFHYKHMTEIEQVIDGSASIKYRCDLCGKCFIRRDVCLKHIREVHAYEIDGSKPKSCEICDMTFKSERHFERST